MQAAQLLQLYAAGKRDFQGADLRGQNFRGKNLAGADFSGADIRSTDFARANLTGATFSGAKARLQKRWVVAQLILLFLMAALAGFLQGLSGYWIVLFFDPAL